MARKFEPISETEAENWIERVQNLDIQKHNIDVIKRKINYFPKGFTIESVPISEGETIYRARILDSKPSQVSDLGYPEKHHVSEFGRANRPHNPIFYASSGASAAVFEKDPEPGDRVAILKWRLTDEILLSKIGYSDEVLSRLNSSRELEDIPQGLLPETESRGNSRLRKYLAKLFTRRVPEERKHHHKLTAALAEMCRKGDIMCGNLYPTVEMWGNADNLAIETDVVDESLEPISAEYIEIQMQDDQQIKTDTLDTCRTIENSELQWNGHGHRWVLDKDDAWGAFLYEDGRWKLKDSSREGAKPQHDPNFEY